MPSSVIQRFQYDKKKRCLQVVFVSGAVYNYENVPQALYEAMKTAKSKGEFLNHRVKPAFSYRKVSG
jgi:hypothetical protein